MARLTIYGDFNCPFSVLASVRADVLLAAGGYTIDWRAVQHDTEIPASGAAVEGDTAKELAGEVAAIADLSERDVRLHLVVPPVRPNTAAACAAFAPAGDDADVLRRRLFAAVWAAPSAGRTSSRPFDGRSPRHWCCRTGTSPVGSTRSSASPSSSPRRRRRHQRGR